MKPRAGGAWARGAPIGLVGHGSTSGGGRGSPRASVGASDRPAGGGRGAGGASGAAASASASVGAGPGTPRGACPFRYIVVLDFEATCDNPVQTSPQEIIELPSVLVDTVTNTVVDEFRVYVRPVVHPKLSAFCTSLTGITQDQVDAGVPITEAWRAYLKWLEGKGFFGPDAPTFTFATCGDWDLKTMLPLQASVASLDVPSCFKSWCNVKVAYKNATGTAVRGMPDMLAASGLRLEGRHHSGLDDCRNIAQCVRYLIAKGHGTHLGHTWRARK